MAGIMVNKIKSKAVFGIYATRMEAEAAVTALKKVGFSMMDISVVVPEIPGSQGVGHVKSTKSPEGATTGASAGALLGGALGLLAGIGALAIPGFGPFIAAGPIMGTLAGLGVGSVVGGISGALIGLGLPEYEAKRFEGSLKNGGILLSVHADTSEEVASARQILKITGAKDIATAAEEHGKTKDQSNVEWKSVTLSSDVTSFEKGGSIPPTKGM
jgi:uncharacterized membrane protein